MARRRISLTDMIASMAEEIEASIPADQVQSPTEEIPLWEPMRICPACKELWPCAAHPTLTPRDTPQVRALSSPADELFFGGGGGGGKSDLLVGAAVTQHKNSVIFRVEFTQLRGAQGIWERSKQIIGVRGRPNESTFTWRDLPGGRALEFGAARTDRDMLKYRGRPHDLKGFDELPEFTEAVYLFLCGWLRTAVPGQRTRVIGTGNPPTTAEGQWIIRRWAPWLQKDHPNPAKDGELRWFVMKDGKDTEVPGPKEGWERPAPIPHTKPNGQTELLYPRSRTFIRALVDDNPYYMRTGYDQILAAMPEPLRSQMRFGDFQATAKDDPWQVIPTAWVDAAIARWTAEPPGPLTAVGNDPSRGGTAEFVIAKRHGHWVNKLEVHAATAAPDGAAGAGLLFKSLEGNADIPIQIDIIGSAGSSVFDHARGLKLKAIEMNGSAKTEALDKSGKLGFYNKRAEWHWKLREALDPSSGQDLALPPDPQMRADLCAPRWRPTPRGIQVEPKEDIVKRIGRSPDRGEAVIYACATEYIAQTVKVIAW